MHAYLDMKHTWRRLLAGALLWLALLSFPLASSRAGTFAIGGADGSFETGLGGMVTAGDVRLVPSVGSLRPTQGSQAAWLTTEPDSGPTLADVDVSLLRIENFTLPVDAEQLRLDYSFLSNELSPSFANDRFSVTLVLIDAGGHETLLQTDTFDPAYPAPWTGYARQTGFRTLVADLAAHAGSGETVTLELRLADDGDGRGNSAVFLDNMRLTSAGEPQARGNYEYVTVSPGETLFLDGSASVDPDGAITEYRWDFGDGTLGIGRFAEYAYTEAGIYQATLTVTDDTGNTSSDTFTVVVGSINQAPRIVSAPTVVASENTLYRYDVEADDSELAFGDTLTFSLLTGPAGMVIDPGSGMLTWIPTVDDPRRNPVTVQVTDSLGLSDTQSFTVTIDVEVYIVAADDSGRLYTARSNGDETFDDYRFVDDTGSNTRGVAIADFDKDGDFDFVSGHAQNPSAYLYYYEKQGPRFAPPVLLGTVGDSTTSAGSWLMDMAAGDVNNDGAMDFAVNGSNSSSWLFLNQGHLTFGQASFFGSDFEADDGTWDGAQCSTGFARDDTTAHGGSWSMRVFATRSSCLSIDINPSNWQVFQGPTLTFAYRIPHGVPVGLLFNVSGRGWVFLGGSPAATPGPYPAVPAATLVDDDQWHTVTIDLYHSIRQQ